MVSRVNRVWPLVAVQLALLLGACATTGSGVSVEPEATTYPRTRVVQTTTRMVLTPPIDIEAGIDLGPLGSRTTAINAQPSNDFTRTSMGDDALAEFAITPTAFRGADPASLRSALGEGASAYCDGADYRVIEAQYQVPQQATAQLLGMTTPYLDVRARCAIRDRISLDAVDMIVAEVATRSPDANFFDFNRQRFAVPASILTAAFQTAIQGRGHTIISERDVDGGRAYVTDAVQRGVMGFGSNQQIIAVIFDRGETSELGFQLQSWGSTFISSPDVSPLVSSNYFGNAPVARDVAYQHASAFLGDVVVATEALMPPVDAPSGAMAAAE